ncbi:hypothetical protein TNCV_157661 [Trichonephila clavipes]|nr:hypothetical protein TNCV_157661 [Trichonephila clavipes]
MLKKNRVAVKYYSEAVQITEIVRRELRDLRFMDVNFRVEKESPFLAQLWPTLTGRNTMTVVPFNQLVNDSFVIATQSIACPSLHILSTYCPRIMKPV